MMRPLARLDRGSRRIALGIVAKLAVGIALAMLPWFVGVWDLAKFVLDLEKLFYVFAACAAMLAIIRRERLNPEAFCRWDEALVFSALVLLMHLMLPMVSQSHP